LKFCIQTNAILRQLTLFIKNDIFADITLTLMKKIRLNVKYKEFVHFIKMLA